MIGIVLFADRRSSVLAAPSCKGFELDVRVKEHIYSEKCCSLYVGCKDAEDILEVLIKLHNIGSGIEGILVSKSPGTYFLDKRIKTVRLYYNGVLAACYNYKDMKKVPRYKLDYEKKEIQI